MKSICKCVLCCIYICKTKQGGIDFETSWNVGSPTGVDHAIYDSVHVISIFRWKHCCASIPVHKERKSYTYNKRKWTGNRLGAIRANSQSDISLTVTLYKKSGSYWYKVASWSNSASAISLKIEKKYTVSQGTYKVVTHGSVTTSAGNTEQLSETSNQITYSAQ